jgi:hypothetical protein
MVDTPLLYSNVYVFSAVLLALLADLYAFFAVLVRLLP